MSKLEQLETFIKVIECNGIAKAAEALHMSPSAITKQIQALEAKIRTVLFDRTKRNLKLTEIGEQYYIEACNTIKNLQQLESLIQTNQKEISGILKIRSMQFIANKFVIPRLEEFLSLYPKLQVNLESLEILPNFWKDGIDIVYGSSYPGEDTWVQRKIGLTDIILCGSPKYFKKYGIPATIDELHEHKYLTHTARNPDNLIRLKQLNLCITPYLWCNTYESMIASAKAGIGFVWLHADSVASELSSGELIEIFPEHTLRDQSMYLYYQNGQYIQPKIRAFVDFFSSLKK